jgi:transposase
MRPPRWATSRHEQRSTWERAYLTKVCDIDPVVALASDLAQRFVAMVRNRDGTQFDAWLTVVEASEIRELRTFAASLQRDGDAVRAALTLPYSNGQTEGQVQRLKVLKRTMYGQAGFELLRKRMLYHEQSIPIPQPKPLMIDRAA